LPSDSNKHFGILFAKSLLIQQQHFVNEIGLERKQRIQDADQAAIDIDRGSEAIKSIEFSRSLPRFQPCFEIFVLVVRFSIQ
jgi:hypothetical protein